MENQNTKILRLPQVMSKTGLSRSSIYAFMQKEEFPKAINIGARAIGWLKEDVNRWIEKRRKPIA